VRRSPLPVERSWTRGCARRVPPLIVRVVTEWIRPQAACLQSMVFRRIRSRRFYNLGAEGSSLRRPEDLEREGSRALGIALGWYDNCSSCRVGHPSSLEDHPMDRLRNRGDEGRRHDKNREERQGSNRRDLENGRGDRFDGDDRVRVPASPREEWRRFGQGIDPGGQDPRRDGLEDWQQPWQCESDDSRKSRSNAATGASQKAPTTRNGK